MSQVRAGGAYVELTARSAQFLKGLEAAQKRLKSFGASTRLVGTKLTGLGVAAAAPVGASLAVYTSFDDAIRSAGAAANATGATLESLRNKAKQRAQCEHARQRPSKAAGKGEDHAAPA